METGSIASAYAQEVIRRPDMQHAAVRIGLWLAGVAEQQGGFPVIANSVDFIRGIHTKHINAEGVCFRPETVSKSLEALQTEGLLEVSAHPYHGTGKRAPKCYTLKLG
jgi:hypothetical protein